MKNTLCNIFGHKWVHRWHSHNHYYAVTCTRCGTQIHRTTKKGINDLNVERLECLFKSVAYAILFIAVVSLAVVIYSFYIRIGG